jgi:hypothetical protein
MSKSRLIEQLGTLLTKYQRVHYIETEEQPREEVGSKVGEEGGGNKKGGRCNANGFDCVPNLGRHPKRRSDKR